MMWELNIEKIMVVSKQAGDKNRLGAAKAA
jgi:hypothetical protein